MHFYGQNQKKFRKQTLIIFWFYMKICLPTFSGGPLGWDSDIISKNSHEKKLRHISKFSYGSYKIFGRVGTLVTKKKSKVCLRHCVFSQVLEVVPSCTVDKGFNILTFANFFRKAQEGFGDIYLIQNIEVVFTLSWECYWILNVILKFKFKAIIILKLTDGVQVQLKTVFFLLTKQISVTTYLSVLAYPRCMSNSSSSLNFDAWQGCYWHRKASYQCNYNLNSSKIHLCKWPVC